ncbi:MAG TPA: S8 family serine peptidase, partial [Candidatus Nanopelagicales bacterium]|nr:S8 family serine peptidase [Candidatus Nanopelagicales bacterium]
MYEARVRQAVPRGLVALCLACATAIPLGAIATPTAAIPTHRVLLSTTGEVTEVASAVTAVGGTVVQTFEIAQALLADLPEHVTAPEGSFVVPNVTMRFNAAPTATTSDSANTFRETIGAPAGPTGSGVTVAVIDTGVDDSAPVDVAKHVNVSEGPVGDGLGHGTFMAGLVAGDDDEFGGVAPGAEVLDVQVAAQDGSTDLAR